MLFNVISIIILELLFLYSHENPLKILSCAAVKSINAENKLLTHSSTLPFPENEMVS